MDLIGNFASVLFKFSIVSHFWFMTNGFNITFSEVS